MTGLRAEAPAKVNLALAVTGRRADGFHTLRSIFLRLALHDDLEAQVRGAAELEDDLVVTGDPGLPVTDNLVLRTVRSLRDELGEAFPALAFHLHKRIPTAAGLAGGSSDAAAALDLAAAAWGLRLHPAERLQAALRLGADVPFFAAGHGAALVGGIGEHLEPLPMPEPAAGILLVTSPRRLATARVFAALDAGARPQHAAGWIVQDLAVAIRAGLDAAGLADLAAGAREANELWAAAVSLSPDLAQLRARLESELGCAFLLTGSGPTLFAVQPSEPAALEAARHLRASPAKELSGAHVIATRTQGGPRP